MWSWSQKPKTKRQRTWDKLPLWIKKKPPDSSRGHKISTRNGSVIGSDLTYKFEKLDRSSQGVRFEKPNKVPYPLQPRARVSNDLKILLCILSTLYAIEYALHQRRNIKSRTAIRMLEIINQSLISKH
jgi:hypothetical protein